LRVVLKKLIVATAILVPLVPTLVWLGPAVEGLAEAGDRAAVYVYFPARLMALVGFVLMFYQFVLSARMSILEHVFSRPNLVRAHRTLGKIGFLLILFHGLLMIVVDFLDFGALIFTWQKLLGMGALFLLITAVIASWFFKPLQFSARTWKKIHLLAYVAFPLAFVHAITIGLTLRTSRPLALMFAMLFAWYVAMVTSRLFGAARGVLHPANVGAGRQKPAGAKPSEAAPQRASAPTGDTTEPDRSTDHSDSR
jgi:DMSO/TMAO reductase YedYZ heme-binding membrane subunit